MASRKQIAAAKRNIKKAQAARRKKSRSKTKRRKSKPKGKKRSRSRSKSSHKKSKSRMKRFSKDNLKNGFKGFLGGGGAGELAEDAISFGTDNLLINKGGRAVASAAGGWWTGQKSMAGAIGGLINAGLDIGLSAMRGQTIGGPGRFGRL